MGSPLVDVRVTDSKTIKDLLEKGAVRSTSLVGLYLSQIDKHDGYLHDMLSMPSRESLQKIATELDKERAAGKVRSALHGTPIIVKVYQQHYSHVPSSSYIQDNINTHPKLGMLSAAGSFALEHARPSDNARLVNKVNERES